VPPLLRRMIGVRIVSIMIDSTPAEVPLQRWCCLLLQITIVMIGSMNIILTGAGSVWWYYDAPAEEEDTI
jgi:hypothetical protein